MHCCFIPCDAEAEFQIRTTTFGGGIAGPDPYCDSTEACEAHVGALLGWQPDIHPDNLRDVMWEVTAIHQDREESEGDST